MVVVVVVLLVPVASAVASERASGRLTLGISGGLIELMR